MKRLRPTRDAILLFGLCRLYHQHQFNVTINGIPKSVEEVLEPDPPPYAPGSAASFFPKQEPHRLTKSIQTLALRSCLHPGHFLRLLLSNVARAVWLTCLECLFRKGLHLMLKAPTSSVLHRKVQNVLLTCSLLQRCGAFSAVHLAASKCQIHTHTHPSSIHRHTNRHTQNCISRSPFQKS